MVPSGVPHPANPEPVDLILERLEQRIARIEVRLNLQPQGEEYRQISGNASAGGIGAGDPTAAEPELELRLGEAGLAWLAGLVLPLGLAFLIVLLQGSGRPLPAVLLGVVASGGLYALSGRWRITYPSMAKVLLPASMLLLFFTTLRIHFFTEHPLVPWKIPGLALLLLIPAIQMGLALRRSSQVLALLGMLMGIVAALLAEIPHLTLGLTVALVALSVWLLEQRGWRQPVMGMTALAYLTFFTWIMGIRLLGGGFDPVTDMPSMAIYPFLLAGLFALPSLRSASGTAVDSFPTALVIFNTGGFIFSVTLLAITHFSERPAIIFLPAAAYLLGWSVLIWKQTRVSFAPAFYGCISFLALSSAFFAATGLPEAFFWLALQSQLVISLALWYRSRLLVVANTGIFITILATYLIMGPLIGYVSFTFALVALASARIMNWKKERLELRTELLRNTYLAVAFFMVLFSIYRAVPDRFISLSWTASAAVWFFLSLLLKNRKYRHLAMGTLLATVLHLFIIDLARLDAGFRIAAFLGLGIIAVVISLFYTRIRNLIGKEPSGNTS